MRKGKYKEIKGNLIQLAKEGEFEIIAHGANCFQMMGAGIALQIKNEFPSAFGEDRADMRYPLERLGDLTHAYIPEYKFQVVNLYTQYKGGPNLDYAALELSLRKMTLIFPLVKKIGLPLIGCGIAGGDWNKVKRIIKRVLSEYDVTIVIYDK